MNTNAKTASRTKFDSHPGEAAAGRIVSAWKGDFVTEASVAAFQLGLLVAGSMLSYDRAKTILRFHFDFHKVDDIHWSTANESLLCGRNAIITGAEIRNWLFPIAANDNTKDDSINAETLLGMDFAPLEYVIPGYVVEGLTERAARLQPRPTL